MINLKTLGLYPSSAYLGIACCVLLAVLCGEWQLGLRNQDLALASSPPQQSNSELENLVLDANARYSGTGSILLSPLFIEGRKPIAAMSQLSSTANSESLKLTGVLLAPQGLIALIQDDKKNSYRLKEGDTAFGWRIDTIKPNLIILTNGNQGKELRLIEGNSPAKPEAMPNNQDLQSIEGYTNSPNLPMTMPNEEVPFEMPPNNEYLPQ